MNKKTIYNCTWIHKQNSCENCMAQDICVLNQDHLMTGNGHDTPDTLSALAQRLCKLEKRVIELENKKDDDILF